MNKKSRHETTSLDLARDELFSHIHRCGVLQAEAQQQQEWMDDTVDYMAERYPDLSEDSLTELKEIGMRFCRPVIRHGKDDTALTLDADAEQDADSEVVAA